MLNDGFDALKYLTQTVKDSRLDMRRKKWEALEDMKAYCSEVEVENMSRSFNSTTGNSLVQTASQSQLVAKTELLLKNANNSKIFATKHPKNRNTNYLTGIGVLSDKYQ